MQDTVSYTIHSFLLPGQSEQGYSLLFVKIANKHFPIFHRITRYSKSTKLFECKVCSAREDAVFKMKRHVVRMHKEILEIKKPEDPNKSAEDEEKSSEDPEKVLDNTKQKETKGSKFRDFCLETDANIVWQCQECDEILQNKHDHRKLHDKNKQTMVCHLCGNVLNTVKSWKEHMKTHQAKALGVKILCKICGQAFVKVCSLNSHMKFHSQKRPHICDTCGKGFKTKCHLTRHMVIHDVGKHLICSFCGKAFNNESNLRGHTRIHTGEKPYKCELCPADFTHNVSLKSHKKSAHGIDMWKISGRKSCAEVPDEVIKTAKEGIPKSKEYAAVKDLLSLTGKDLMINDENSDKSFVSLRGWPSISHDAGVKDAKKELPSAASARENKSNNGIGDSTSKDNRSDDTPIHLTTKHPPADLSKTKPPNPLIQPNPSIQHPNPLIQQPNPSVQQSSLSVQQPNPSVQQPSPSIQQPIQQSNPSVQQPNPLIQQPIQRPNASVQPPNPSIQQPNTSVQQTNPLTHPPYSFMGHHQAAASEFMNIHSHMRGPPYNMPDVPQSAEEYWEAARRTFTKL